MTIAFIHQHKSFLPEIEAYTNFFNKYGITIEVFHTKMRDKIEADVEWYFMGTDGGKKKKNAIVIHEYASASIPPFQKGKDLLKRLYNQQPDYRLFLNQYVRQRLNFQDGTPFGFREMGVADLFFSHRASADKEYDFIYTGSMAPDREVEKLLQCFTKNDLQRHSLLIVSRDYKKIEKQFAAFSNIHFQGPVGHIDIPNHILKARFCINYMPDKEPFNQQTPVKFLEYLALQMPVISSRYAWTEQFQQNFGGNFFYLEKDFSDFTWERVSGHNYSCPDLRAWKWDNQIRKSGILEFLQSKFKELHF